MNITPDSFSDGGELTSPDHIISRFSRLGGMDALDIGAESTAPLNASLSWEEEWGRWKLVLPLLKGFPCTISADTYHVETIFELVKFWKDGGVSMPLIWNDVSGKFDESVQEFLQERKDFSYVLCHNRVPERRLAGRHMEYVATGGNIERELEDFFLPHRHPQVIFDPCLGFSKTYEENWFILDHFSKLQELIPHGRWLLGFSRKSFLRKKLGLGLEDRELLDVAHQQILRDLLPRLEGEVWIRTHRPDLIYDGEKKKI